MTGRTAPGAAAAALLIAGVAGGAGCGLLDCLGSGPGARSEEGSAPQGPPGAPDAGEADAGEARERAPEQGPPPVRPPAGGAVRFRDRFDGETLDERAWHIVRAEDVRRGKVAVVDRGDPGDGGSRLAVSLDTLKTDDATVKLLGARTQRTFDLRTGARFAVDVDWNDQRNGAYLTAAVYLCPTLTDGNPEEEADWLKFEYVGVPQDNLTRSVIAMKAAGVRQWLDREGWPKVRRGRKVGNHRIEIVVDAADLVIFEAGRPKLRLYEHGLRFTEAAIYLVVTSHSNYFGRTIYFDNVEVTEAEVPK